MNVVVDENIYTEGVDVLRSNGHDCISIYEDYRGMSDTRILELAISTNRVLVTRDRDFGELVFARNHAAPRAIIYIRLRNVSHEAYGEAAARLIEAEGERIMGHLITITAQGTRWRELPT